jgi:hypothetical protein
MQKRLDVFEIGTDGVAVHELNCVRCQNCGYQAREGNGCNKTYRERRETEKQRKNTRPTKELSEE